MLSESGIQCPNTDFELQDVSQAGPRPSTRPALDDETPGIASYVQELEQVNQIFLN